MASTQLRRRERNGRLQRRSAQEREFAPTFSFRVRKYGDPLYGSALGRMRLSGVINDAEFAAGEKWQALAAQYGPAIGLANPLVSFNVQTGINTPPDPDSTSGLLIAKYEARVIRRFRAAHAALQSAGARPEAVTRAVCERNEDCWYGWQADFVSGLRMLVRHWMHRSS